MSETYYSVLHFDSIKIRLMRFAFVNGKINICNCVSKTSDGYKDSMIISKELVTETVKELINESVKNIDYKIEKLIVILPSKNLLVVKKHHEIIPLNGVASEKEINSLKAEIVRNNIEQSKTCVNLDITKYYKDGLEISKDSLVNQKCMNLGLDGYLSYLDNDLSRKVIDVVEGLDIKVVSVISDPSSLNELVSNSNNEKIIIDIKDNYSSISKYSSNHMIDYIRYDEGVSLVIREIMNNHNLEEKEAREIFNKYKNVLGLRDDNLKIKQIIKDGYDKLISGLSKKIQIFIPNVTNDEIYISGEYSSIYGLANLLERYLENEVSILKNEYVGNEDYIYSSCIGAGKNYIEGLTRR